MRAPTAIGNDVVDLSDGRTRGKASDDRFLARVLTEEERRTVAAASDADTALWTHWAGKEAAYKVVSQLRGDPPVFVHREFVVEGEAVAYHGSRYPLRIDRRGAMIHGVSCSGAELEDVAVGVERLDAAAAPWNRPLAELMDRLSDREADAVHSRASAAVRVAARAALAQALSVDEGRLEIVCAPGVTGRRPPRVVLDGSPAAVDLSLSHHGAWIAWAILVH